MPERGTAVDDRVMRVVDAAVVLVGVVILVPFFVVLALLIRRDLGSPVPFRQLRPGLHGEVLTLKKFRTMTDERDPDGDLLPDEQRLTLFGRFLRATSLDEDVPELRELILGLDVQILIRTLWVMLTHQGVSRTGHATEPRLTASNDQAPETREPPAAPPKEEGT